ncbi:Transcriptional regulator [Penicillium canariense]|uniref:Transcriptional regulator n=1 Tax=Penicillium canariense TaxID=189055 RepID=A0A9W9HMT6_9EURO|nr:Transcriptional regulator [Penicillium canariense]KAJ5153108.1 Transcriptional regulator [Penicillium canariense]
MAPKYSLSDSESEAEVNIPAVPSDNALEQGLRDEVAAKFKSGNMAELTVKRVRFAVEEKLGLEQGFFRTTGDWKAKSEKIIKDEFQVQESAPQQETEPRDLSPSPPPLAKKKAAPKRSKGESAPKPRKRQKTQTPISEEDELSELSELSEPSSGESEQEAKKPKKRAIPVKRIASSKPATEPSPEGSDAEDAGDANPTAELTKDDSESEMSIVLDEEPKPKPVRKRKSSEGAPKKAAPKKEKKVASKGSKEEELDPDQAEIRRLQGWLVKCGIRKMWWRELQPYETPKAKIKHLKQMLEDVGMTGRYSLEKARQIRDERELKADLEQIQQGAKQWGTGTGGEGNEDEGSDGGAPPRRAARGRQALAFLESDGEETD